MRGSLDMCGDLPLSPLTTRPLTAHCSLLTARCSLLAAYCSSLTTVRCGYMPLSLVLRINGEPHRALAVAERCVHLMPTPKP